MGWGAYKNLQSVLVQGCPVQLSWCLFSLSLAGLPPSYHPQVLHGLLAAGDVRGVLLSRRDPLLRPTRPSLRYEAPPRLTPLPI